MSGQVVRIAKLVCGPNLQGADGNSGRAVNKTDFSRADLAVARPSPSALLNSRARYGMVILR